MWRLERSEDLLVRESHIKPMVFPEKVAPGLQFFEDPL